MNAHDRKHPERYVNGSPIVARPPARVAINPDDGEIPAGAIVHATPVVVPSAALVT
jgi:hypothetical protein